MELGEFEEQFSTWPVVPLIKHFASLSAPYDARELTALFGRFVDLAFIEGDVTNASRALAAVWARSLTAFIGYSFEDGSQDQLAFFKYHEQSAQMAIGHGYGTAMFKARNAPGSIIDIFNGDGLDHETTVRREFLVGVAFGRVIDDEE